MAPRGRKLKEATKINVLADLANGKSIKAIARDADLAPSTVSRLKRLNKEQISNLKSVVAQKAIEFSEKCIDTASKRSLVEESTKDVVIMARESAYTSKMLSENSVNTDNTCNINGFTDVMKMLNININVTSPEPARVIIDQEPLPVADKPK